MSNKVISAAEGMKEVDIRYLWIALLEAKYWLIACTVVAFFIGKAMLYFIEPVYKADALIQIEEKTGKGGGIQFFFRPSKADGEIQVIRSRLVLLKAVESTNLDILVEPKYFPIFGKPLVSFRHKHGSAPMFWGDEYARGNEHISVEVFDVPDTYRNKPLSIRYKSEGIIELYNHHSELLISGAVGQLLTANAGSEDIIRLKVASLKAHIGMEFSIKKLTKLRAINLLSRGLIVSEEGQRTGIVSLQKIGTDKEFLLKSLNAIVQAYQQQNLDRRLLQVENGLKFLNDELPRVKNALAISEKKLNEFRREQSSVDLNFEAQTVLGQLVQIDSQLQQLALQEIEIANYYTEDHPKYQALSQQKRALQVEKKKLVAATQKYPVLQQEVLTLSREVEAGTRFYSQLVNKVQDLNLVKAGVVSNVRILDRAIVYPEQVRPNPSKIVMIASFSGLLFSILTVLVYRIFFRNGIESLAQLELLNLPVYATIPVSNFQRNLNKQKQQDNQLLCQENPADLAIESIRSIRTSLHFATMESKNNVLMITGATPGIGKSFVSSNLACLCANAGQKVLLIDADMRRGALHTALGLSPEYGLSDAISGVVGIEKAIVHTQIEGMDYLYRGQVPPNPSELLMSSAFENLVNWAHENYDMVIIDTPPVLAVTDAAIIGRFAGTALFVVRYHLNTVHQVELALERCKQNKIDVKGFVFNAVERMASTHEYAYYDYK